MSWSIDSSQNKVSADQYHMSISGLEHTAVKRSAREQFMCNCRQIFHTVLNFPLTFALKPKVNAVPGKLRFIRRLWIGNLAIHLH